MSYKIDEDVVFKNSKPADIEGHKRVFERCEFLNCDLSYANLSHITFIDCVFKTCNLSLVQLTDTGLQNVSFQECKLAGAHFDKSNHFSFEVSFTGCNMTNSIFYKKRLKGTKFSDCILNESDFSEADLTSAVFDNCDLNRVIFDNTILKGADFSSAYNFVIDPENNSIAKAKFSIHGLSGLLAKYKITITG
ncbi:pentapeptide repeat-containing protein [Mucilaginibacter gynuensis]|uniref:Pentapeptide repeat-containing protein n=1 Tax=Mucilaginibacter gynuensis TaxID=1302236 RepID=A0ABP8G380_9SPHI